MEFGPSVPGSCSCSQASNEEPLDEASLETCLPLAAALELPLRNQPDSILRLEAIFEAPAKLGFCFLLELSCDPPYNYGMFYNKYFKKISLTAWTCFCDHACL